MVCILASPGAGMLLTPRAPSTTVEGAEWLVVADGHEIFEDAVAGVGPALDHFLTRRPILVASRARAEDAAAAPATLDIFDALEQAGVLLPGAVDAAHLQSVGGDVSAAAALGMTQHDEQPAGDIDHGRSMLLVSLFQDRRIAVFRGEGHYAGQGVDLTELGGIDVFERVEIDDDALLALRDLVRGQPAPVARTRWAHDILRPQVLTALEPSQVLLGILR